MSRNRGSGADWKAQVCVGKTLGYDPPLTTFLGYFPTELAAAQAVDDEIYANVPGLIPKANFPPASHFIGRPGS